MLLAVPATIFIADSTLKAFKSVILSSAISLTWSQVIVATFTLLGSPDPLFFLAAAKICAAAGAVLIINSNDLSANTVITTGTIPLVFLEFLH